MIQMEGDVVWICYSFTVRVRVPKTPEYIILAPPVRRVAPLRSLYNRVWREVYLVGTPHALPRLNQLDLFHPSEGIPGQYRQVKNATRRLHAPITKTLDAEVPLQLR